MYFFLYVFFLIYYKGKTDLLKSEFFFYHTQFSKFLCDMHFKTLQ